MHHAWAAMDPTRGVAAGRVVQAGLGAGKLSHVCNILQQAHARRVQRSGCCAAPIAPNCARRAYAHASPCTHCVAAPAAAVRNPVSASSSKHSRKKRRLGFAAAQQHGDADGGWMGGRAGGGGGSASGVAGCCPVQAHAACKKGLKRMCGLDLAQVLETASVPVLQCYQHHTSSRPPPPRCAAQSGTRVQSSAQPMNACG